MKIVDVDTWRESVPLSRPYTIAYKTTSAVDLFFVRLTTDTGHVGVGSGSPGEHVTKESATACEAALGSDVVAGLQGEDPRGIGRLAHRLRESLVAAPAARAAVDMALYDLFARILDVPVADVLGRCHDGLPTSITVGIQSVEETIDNAREYVAAGFDHLKIKLGHSYDEDQERIRHLREAFGSRIKIRVDVNQGYDGPQTARMADWLDTYDVELVEQPVAADAIDVMRSLPDPLRRRLAADESLIDETAAVELAAWPQPCGIYNIKLMKCGGITPARTLAEIARAAQIELMWGCMDESRVSIAAALHIAYASPATRYLDLDGSLDLARDPACGGFVIRDGRMWLTDAPGLGAQLASPGENER